MSDPTRESLHGVTLYNPHLLSKDELKRDFVARRAQFDALVADLRSRTTSTPQHHLILGQRGMGKSTLLRRIAYEVQDDAELNAAYIPLLFPEEQYNIKHLGDLWLNCLDALSDALEAEGNKQQSDELDRAIEATHQSSPSALEDAARNVLFASARRLGRRFVLLLDNADVVFDRIKEGDWGLRDAISKSDALVLIGASSNAIEHTHRYGQAFYDFFRVTRLGGLQDDEARDVLLALADRQGSVDVRRIVMETPERVSAVRTLAGGNPRTIATLYGILAGSTHGDVRGDLEMLLDRHTPLYKARFEALPDQAQQVVDALCILWDPARASEVAEHVGLEVNKVSAQLDRLVTDGIVEKVLSVDKKTGRKSKKHAFQIAERFFNIWYLMRASRRVRRKLIWLVRFLEAMHGRRGLTQEATRIMRLIGDGRHSEHDVEFALSLVERLPTSRTKSGLVWAIARRDDVHERHLTGHGDALGLSDIRLVERAARVKGVRDQLTRALFGIFPEASGMSHSTDIGYTISRLVDAFMMNPAVPWEHKLELVAEISQDEGSLTKLFLVLSMFEVFVSTCVVPMMAVGVDVYDDDMFKLISEGLDLGTAEFERVLSTRNRSRSDDVNVLMESVHDMAIVLWNHISMSIIGRGLARSGRPGFDTLARSVEEWSRDMTDLSKRRPAWTVQRIALLVSKDDSDDADSEIRALLGIELGKIQPSVDSLMRFAVRMARASLVRDRLDRTGLADEWLPIRHALHALAIGSKDVLDGLAPELRDPASVYYDKWVVPAHGLPGVNAT